jgi:hypothetical protein
LTVDHRALFERVSRAINDRNFAALDELFTDDYLLDYPQSGERIRGLANFRATLENYPSGVPRDGIDKSTMRVESDERWVVTPMFTVVRVEGSGTVGTATFKNRYPDGSIWWTIQMYELEGDRIARATTFFAPAFEAPEWRTPYVELVAQDEGRPK